MNKIFTLLLVVLSMTSKAQNDFNSQIQRVADTLAKKIIQSGNKKVAVVDFINLDESHTRLGEFLSDELSSELSNLTDNLTKFEVVERSNIEIIFKEKKLIQSNDGPKLAKDLGRLNVADILIWAIISDFEGYFRVNIKLLDTKTGSALSAFKTQFIKTSALDNFYKEIIKKKEDVTLSNNITTSKEETNLSSQPLPEEPCKAKSIGILRITNKTQMPSAAFGHTTKIAVKVPKRPGINSTKDSDYYFIILERDETKEI
ncbi:MAG: hypothetical protein JSR97_03170 [Verrucomicrobia bacterium]|nr:hypothetical protein [Verrucomicrobiota bacterium]